MQPEQPMDIPNEHQLTNPITREVYDQILKNTEAIRSGDPIQRPHPPHRQGRRHDRHHARRLSQSQ